MAPFWHHFTHFHCCKVSKRASRFLGKPHKIQLFTDYSIIVATRPEPTVRPPSRYLNSVFCGIFYTFYCGKQRKIVVFVWRIFICMISWHRFGTKILFSLSTLITWCQHHVFLVTKEICDRLYFTTHNPFNFWNLKMLFYQSKKYNPHFHKRNFESFQPFA